MEELTYAVTRDWGFFARSPGLQGGQETTMKVVATRRRRRMRRRRRRSSSGGEQRRAILEIRNEGPPFARKVVAK
jgi:hypothetical protein